MLHIRVFGTDDMNIIPVFPKCICNVFEFKIIVDFVKPLVGCLLFQPAEMLQVWTYLDIVEMAVFYLA